MPCAATPPSDAFESMGVFAGLWNSRECTQTVEMLLRGGGKSYVACVLQPVQSFMDEIFRALNRSWTHLQSRVAQRERRHLQAIRCQNVNSKVGKEGEIQLTQA